MTNTMSLEKALEVLKNSFFEGSSSYIGAVMLVAEGFDIPMDEMMRLLKENM